MGSGAKKMLKYAKTATVLNYFECYFIYPKVCKVYCICLLLVERFLKRTCRPLSDFNAKIYLLLKPVFC